MGAVSTSSRPTTSGADLVVARIVAATLEYVTRGGREQDEDLEAYALEELEESASSRR